jgi:hypothetical protein
VLLGAFDIRQVVIDDDYLTDVIAHKSQVFVLPHPVNISDEGKPIRGIPSSAKR